MALALEVRSLDARQDMDWRHASLTPLPSPPRQIMENAEINSIIKILGLQYKKNYSDPESLKSLRYGKLMIMTDQVGSRLLLLMSTDVNAA